MGANLPFDGQPPQVTLQAAVAAMAADLGAVVAVSRFFATPCFPAGAGPDYVNAAAVIRMADPADPARILASLHTIEARFGRERLQRWGMRTLDLDLLALGDCVLPDVATQDAWRNLPPADQPGTAPDRLILPHPRLQDRAFVLVPLADVAPDWLHPRLGKTVRQMIADLPQSDVDAVKPL